MTYLKFLSMGLMFGLLVYEFSAGHWITLGLLLVLALAIVQRVDHISRRHDAAFHSVSDGIARDGGSFPADSPRPRTRTGSRVVSDGGSFERSTVNKPD